MEVKTKQGEPGSSVTKPGDGIQGEACRRLTDVWSRVVLVARLPIWSKESTQTTSSQSHRGFWDHVVYCKKWRLPPAMFCSSSPLTQL